MDTIESYTYCGHSAVLFTTSSGKTVAIDPWLEGNPRCPEELRNPKSIDLIVLSHGHTDHAGDIFRLCKEFNCQVAATFELAMLLIRGGVSQDRVIPMNKGGTIEWEGLRVTLTHAFHSSSFELNGETFYAGEACSVVLSSGSGNIFHAGDTDIFSDLKLLGELYKPKVAFVPIGDVFTMGPKEAALAAKWLNCSLAVPIHYKTFPQLTGTYSEFESECRNREVVCKEVEPGQTEAVK
ncbi:MAG: metal-dependent hydrolase [Candidatus Dadabacteria bacterium]|nr:MAG: metal-dependent hydrolase [Candidatus Dadabacteria bacterium]